MSNGFRVLAHVKDLDESTVKALAGTEPRVPGFPEWLDVDHPRHSFISEEIAAVATEFAVADDRKIHAKFKNQSDAIAARASAKVTIGMETVEIPSAKEARKAAKAAAESEEQEEQEIMHEEAVKANKRDS